MAKAKEDTQPKEKKVLTPIDMLNNIIKETNKAAGKVIVGWGSDMKDNLKVEFVPTPSLRVNSALGGGWARGRIGELSGENQSGKTSLMLATIGEDHKKDPFSVWGWFEAENSVDIEAMARFHGIDMTRFFYMGTEQDDGRKTEDYLDIMESAIRTHALKGLVVNSVAALVPSAELEGSMGDKQVAEQARLMSKMMRKLVATIGKAKTATVFINQLRTNIGGYGDPNVTAGGRALGFYASQRLNLNRVKIEDSDGYKKEDAMKIRARIIKNRLAIGNPFKVADYFVRWGEGIDVDGEVLGLAIDMDFVKKSGGWYAIADRDFKCQGMAKLLDYIDANPDVMAELRAKVEQAVNGGARPEADVLPAEEIEQIEQSQKQAEAEIGAIDEQLENEESGAA